MVFACKSHKSSRHGCTLLKSQ